MSRYFMYGTTLGGIEQLMMLAPNFPQRRSGIVINEYSCAMKSQFRRSGNHKTGTGNHPITYASLLA